jgi:vacuolar-type H+-ATPase subunit F/Vma7
MRTPVHVVCRHETALGMALAGFAPIEAATGAETAAALAALATSPARGGVVLVEAPLYDALPSAARRQIRRDGAPIVMPFPGPAPLAEGVSPEAELLDILRRAVGYRVRLR